jgi:hypothetical protein
MSEEQITKDILEWLENSSWEIISFDYPGSGTGKLLHPDRRINETKNKDGIIPDVIAIKNSNVILMENKDHFSKEDFNKVNELCCNNPYQKGIENELGERRYSRVYFGIGIPDDATVLGKAQSYSSKRNFLLAVCESSNVSVIEDPDSLFTC